uniref:Uncharacterized protein n=2 Tax=Canis lupus TaxID=9612 RepID=A0A8C0PKE4_CANLF
MKSAEQAPEKILQENVKCGVKQIMEEAVTRKFVHEDSSHIISFCGESVACGLESGFFLYGLT